MRGELFSQHVTLIRHIICFGRSFSCWRLRNTGVSSFISFVRFRWLLILCLYKKDEVYLPIFKMHLLRNTLLLSEIANRDRKTGLPHQWYVQGRTFCGICLCGVSLLLMNFLLVERFVSSDKARFLSFSLSMI